MAKAAIKKAVEKTSVKNETTKKSRVAKAAPKKSVKKIVTDAAKPKAPAKKTTRKSVKALKAASTDTNNSTLKQTPRVSVTAKPKGVIKVVKSKIASAAHALADKIRSEDKK